MKKSDASYRNFNQLQSLKYARKANILALQTGNSERIAKSYHNMAIALTNQQMQKESIEYIEKAFQQEYTQKNIVFQAELMFIKANNHSIMGLYTMAYKENREALALLKNAQNSNSTFNLKAKILGEIGSSFYIEEKNIDSASKYYNLMQATLKKIPEKLVVYDLAKAYDAKGYFFLETKQSDSALYYFKKEYDLKIKYNEPVLYMQYCAFGDYYFETGDHEKALDYYLKTVQSLEQHQIQETNYVSVYKTLSEIYGQMGQKEKESYYIKRYAEINSKFAEANKKSTNEALKIILDEKEEDLQKSKSKLYWIIFGIILSALLASLIAYLLHQKTKRKKELEIIEKDKIITQKHEEFQELSEKLNPAFDEVIQLAKTNSPGFFTRFQEVYPEFSNKLLAINPNLITSELKFCALLFLNFSTKDISEFTFTSPKTVQNRKNSIRKKLNIQSDEDIYIWMKNL
ncbi:hypothetical protein ACQWU4_18015 [Chryseobacterium sp. MIQD13]|uniref:hypothetical protein n=1 Tax=Chryseobacterium sp. MIQD13 TaxID=3422310 RepID=UPI003D2DCB67